MDALSGGVARFGFFVLQIGEELLPLGPNAPPSFLCGFFRFFSWGGSWGLFEEVLDGGSSSGFEG